MKVLRLEDMQLIPYDSMYRPTKERLEGTGLAPVYFDSDAPTPLPYQTVREVVYYKEETDEYRVKYEIENNLNIAKEYYKQKVKVWFEDQLANGKIQSSLGFTSDCRRNGSKFDKDNLESLMVLNQYPIFWKDADGEVHQLTEQQAQTLRQEMIQFGLNLYQTKWNLETQIDSFEDIDDLHNFIEQNSEYFHYNINFTLNTYGV